MLTHSKVSTPTELCPTELRLSNEVFILFPVYVCDNATVILTILILCLLSCKVYIDTGMVSYIYDGIVYASLETGVLGTATIEVATRAGKFT